MASSREPGFLQFGKRAMIIPSAYQIFRFGMKPAHSKMSLYLKLLGELKLQGRERTSRNAFLKGLPKEDQKVVDGLLDLIGQVQREPENKMDREACKICFAPTLGALFGKDESVGMQLFDLLVN